ncbi:hypothetical protein SLEP1_g37017 [Rubroshorea leprosula]|uniref:F-box domain-containing protein n=1 Tax=Rubroshorea leprosula TaxID=152421 RepID=A0AAV5KTP6_9ROSI|nr:hypothetical protein SLEP1_g37017 [Rubroshorea leprosula]
MCLTGKSDALSSPCVHNKEEWSILGNLIDDLLVEVLCRLPAKSLIRSKCVCKLWCCLITDVCVPKLLPFTALFGFLYKGCTQRIQYASKLPCRLDNQILFALNTRFAKSFSALMPFEPNTRDFLDCCNGLLLFVRGSVPQYYICNPATKQLVEIPPNSMQERSCYAALAFHPLESPHYKVVCFNHWPDFPKSGTVTLDVFSSECGKWLRHPMTLETTVKVATWTKRCVYLNGVLYMLSHSKHLLHFDLNELNFCATDLPEKDKTDVRGFIGVSRGCLYYSNHDGSTLFVWALQVQHKISKWILKHTIRINDFVKDCYTGIWRIVEKASWFKPYALDPNSGVIFIGVNGGVFRYDPDNKTLELVYSVTPDEGIFSGDCAVFTYTPCLLNLKDCRHVPYVLG